MSNNIEMGSMGSIPIQLHDDDFEYELWIKADKPPARSCHRISPDWVLEWLYPSIIAAFVGSFIVATFAYFFQIYEGWCYRQAIYFVICSITTVGYGDFAPETESGRWLAIFLIFISQTFLWAIIEYLIAAVARGGFFLTCKDMTKDFINKCPNWCRCKKDTHDDVHWGILTKVDEFVKDDEYYNDLKTKFMYELFHPRLTNERGLVSRVKNNDLTEQRDKFITCINDTFELEFDTGKDNRDACEKKCDDIGKEHSLLCPCFNERMCQCSDLILFLVTNIAYMIWLAAFIGEFQGEPNGVCEDEYDSTTIISTTSSSLCTDLYFLDIVDEYNVSLNNPNCLNMNDFIDECDLENYISQSPTLSPTMEPTLRPTGKENARFFNIKIAGSSGESGLCGNESYSGCNNKEVFSWTRAFYFGVVTSSSVGYGDYSAYGGDYRFKDSKIDFIMPWQMLGIVLFGLYVGVLAKIYLNFMFWLSYQCCCERKGCTRKFPLCRFGWCETVYDQAYWEKINELEEYFNKMKRTDNDDVQLDYAGFFRPEDSQYHFHENDWYCICLKPRCNYKEETENED